MEEFNPDEFLAESANAQPLSTTIQQPEVSQQFGQPGIESGLSQEQFNPEQFLAEAKAEKYGTPGQMVQAAVEGAAEGVIGPLAPLIQKQLGVKEEDILGRRQENPITFGTGQALGLGGSMILGTGLGSMMAKTGKKAADIVGLSSKAVEAAPLLHKVGSSAVTQAAEMVVLQSNDEIAKMILNDPNTSVESAISNIGLSAVLGGAGGGFITGAVSPLWKVTGAPLVEKTLGTLKNHLDGNQALLPDELTAAKQTLGVELAPELQAVMSGNEAAIKSFNILKEVGNQELTAGINKFNNELSESVAKSLKISPSDVAVYSENQAGNDLLDAFKREYKAKYEPIAEAMEKRNAQAANIIVPDDARLDKYGKLLEQGMNKVGTDSPAYKLYNDYGNRLLAKENISGMDMLKTELGGEIEKASRAGDVNTLQALRDIRNSIADFQEAQIEKMAYQIGKEGVETAEEIIAQRQLANQQYRDFAKFSNELTDNLGVGRFKGAGTLSNKLSDQVSPEQLLNKFSIKGNADFIPFLQKNFPEVYSQVQNNELKRFMKSAVLSAKEGQEINLKKLSDNIDKTMAGQSEYVRSLFSDEVLAKIQAANKLSDAIPNMKSSGSAGHIARLLEGVPRSAMAAVAMVTGNNPFIGAIIGEVSQKLGRDAPDAIRLAHLKYLGSNQPTNANAFKSMVEFFNATYKNENNLKKATSNLLKAGAQVLTVSQMPSESDRKKLDKTVTQLQQTPDKIFDIQKSDIGYYLPNHQQAIAQKSVNALQYLQTIKPQPHILGPLDKPVPPQPVEIARYNRALDIAQNPNVVLQHIKDGRLQVSDIQDLNSMYPGLYKQMQQKITNEIANSKAEEKNIPYHTRISMSLFLGQPLDGTMTPQAIIAAQPQPKASPQQQAAPGAAKNTSKLGKNNASYMTPLQATEEHRASRDK